MFVNRLELLFVWALRDRVDKSDGQISIHIIKN